MQQNLFTGDITARLARNGRLSRAAQAAGKPEPDHAPVVKIFNPYGGATWLLTESDPDEPDTLFGLCDLGQGAPELGYVSRAEMVALRIERYGLRLPLERDFHFRTEFPLSVYADAARAAGRIIEDRAALQAARARSTDNHT